MRPYTVVLLLLYMNGCSGQKEQNHAEVEAIEYHAATRGSQYSVTIYKDNITVRANGNGHVEKKGKLKEGTWNDFIQILDHIPLQKINTFKGPTAGSSLDRSRMVKVKIKKGFTVYESDYFDEGHPPKKIKMLVDKILAVAETVE